MIHPTYMPFTPDELAQHFTGDADANVNYFVRSAQRWLDFRREHPSPHQPLSASRSARQMEKDERFWTAAALKSLFDRSDRSARLAALLEKTFGRDPPLDAFDSWEACLEGDDLHLYFEAQLPSPSSYVHWLRDHVRERHTIPYVLDAAAASSRRLEGATHLDALFLNPANGFSVLIEAKVLSDISPSVSFDTYRNQLIRNIDVMLEGADGQPEPLNRRDPDRSLFALLTPEGYRERPHSRLYGWLMREYRDDPAALARDLPHRERTDWPRVARRLGWMTFEDIADVAPETCRWLRSEEEEA